MTDDDGYDIPAWLRRNAVSSTTDDAQSPAPHVAVVEQLRTALRDKRGLTLRSADVAALVAHLDALAGEADDATHERAARSAAEASAVDVVGFRASLVRGRATPDGWSPNRSDEF